MSHAPATPLPQLDPSAYALGGQPLQFLADQTGIHGEAELREHVLAVQQNAWKVFQYNCIRNFGFLNLKISRLPAYPDLLKLGKDHPGAIFIDFACCFGNDVRKAVADGYPIENVLASDLQPEFWSLGHTLFRSAPQSFPVPFVPGDIFSDEFLSAFPPATSAPATQAPPLASLTTSLNPLKGHVSAIHVSSFFHLFGQEQQLAAAHKLAALLSPAPCSIIFGTHGTQKKTGVRGVANLRGEKPFCYAAEDWVQLWDGAIFQKGSVKVTTEVRKRGAARVQANEDAETEDPENERFSIAWSVTIL